MDGMGYRLNETWETYQADRSLFQRCLKELTRYRYQLCGAIISAGIAPAVIKYFIFGATSAGSPFDNALLGSLIGVFLGFLIYRKVTAIPGAQAITNVIPAFAAAYATVAVFFLLFRLDYSRFQLIASFALIVSWFGLIQIFLAYLRRPTLGLVGNEATFKLAGRTMGTFVHLQSPTQALAQPNLPLIVDFSADVVGEDWERYLAEAAVAGRPVFSAETFFEATQGRVELDNLSKHSIGQISSDSIYLPTKRYLDIVAALFSLTLLSPFLLVIAVLIKLDSPGPVLFRQDRVGHRGKVFSIYKFRSMSNAPPSKVETSADMTRENDMRITRIGKFIRPTRIDEIPQMLNILMGDMSLIGPRPETVNLSKLYESEIPNYRYRHVVRPGITGWAQVRQGHVTEVDDITEKLKFDFYYVKNVSMWLDLLIIIQTIRVVVTGFGAK